ncbi:MAG: hypothetical protein DLM72_04845 [Candidatus Nitrosopolaris wilkensis]|nr:MAG: hypothetical protein DLM72_04845 [Candidatus Nitrosopolaris wilkensis]
MSKLFIRFSSEIIFSSSLFVSVLLVRYSILTRLPKDFGTILNSLTQQRAGLSITDFRGVGYDTTTASFYGYNISHHALILFTLSIKLELRNIIISLLMLSARSGFLVDSI